jgi:hypothetical protein
VKNNSHKSILYMYMPRVSIFPARDICSVLSRHLPLCIIFRLYHIIIYLTAIKYEWNASTYSGIPPPHPLQLPLSINGIINRVGRGSNLILFQMCNYQMQWSWYNVFSMRRISFVVHLLKHTHRGHIEWDYVLNKLVRYCRLACGIDKDDLTYSKMEHSP